MEYTISPMELSELSKAFCSFKNKELTGLVRHDISNSTRVEMIDTTESQFTKYHKDLNEGSWVREKI